MKEKIIKKTQNNFYTALYLGIALLVANERINAQNNNDTLAISSTADKDYSFTDTVVESVTGDVYSEPSNWQDLKYNNLFSAGWNKPWASPPNGSGGAPRQGWLNAYDGVFYRLGIAVFGWQHGLNGDGYTGDLVNYTPLNQRFEIQTDIPMVSNRGGGSEAQTNFGDLKITPRVILSESKDVTQSFNLTFRAPTGNSYNGN